jgi:membrane associated rhomboid family serine protease
LPERKSIEYKRLIASIYPSAVFIILLWLVRIVESLNGYDFYWMGIYPRKVSGLIGIILAPLVHGNFNHLINNSVPLFFMLTAVFYFYYKVAWKVFSLSYFITGLLVWTIARPSYHIGASGLIYSFGSFLFFSGVFRANTNLLAISLLVTFLYGSMVWGIFPYRPEMSWESHAAGMFTGICLAFIYRHEGPPPAPIFSYSDYGEEDDYDFYTEDDDEDR